MKKREMKIRASEERQLASLRKKSARGTSGLYFMLLIFIIAFVNIIDEVTSNLSVSVQSSFVTEFFVFSRNPFSLWQQSIEKREKANIVFFFQVC